MDSLLTLQRGHAPRSAQIIPHPYNDFIGIGESNALPLADTTKRKYETSLKHWNVYTKEELGMNPVLTKRELETFGSFTQDEIEVRTLIILGFVVISKDGDRERQIPEKSHEPKQTRQCEYHSGLFEKRGDYDAILLKLQQNHIQLFTPRGPSDLSFVAMTVHEKIYGHSKEDRICHI